MVFSPNGVFGGGGTHMGARGGYGRLVNMALAVGVLLCCSQPAFALRFVSFEVLIDGKAVLETSKGDEGEDADTVWRYLKDLKLRPVKGYRLEADGDDPLKATLKGKVVIDAQYGGRAEVKELKLVREKNSEPWRIAPAEVERTFKVRTKPK